MSKLCVVVPCFNESERLQKQIFIDFLVLSNVNFCFVNDGSTDQTIILLQEIQSSHPEKVLVLDLQQNVGKGEAVRTGLLKATEWKDFEFLSYLDADLAVPLSEISLLHESAIKNNQFHFFMGGRLKRLGANINRSPLRHLFGRIFATFASNLFQLPAYDTQCGFKLFKTTIAKLILEKPFYSKWLFDIEILLRIKTLINKNQSYDHICEIPLNNWKEISGSKLKMKDFLTVPFLLIKLKRKYKQLSSDA